MKTPCEVALAIELWKAVVGQRTVEQVSADAYRIAVLGRAVKRLAEKKCNDASYSELDESDLDTKEQEIHNLLIFYHARYERDSLYGRVITRSADGYDRSTCLE